MKKSKRILVTGASSGIGKETAEKLIGQGHKVFVAARRIDKMEDLADKGAIAIKMDITKEEDIQNVFETIEKESQGLDVIVNNAGFAVYGSVEETKVEDARWQFEVNIFGLASLTQKFLPQMRKQKSGTIINISSMAGKVYMPLGAWYHATKHALEGWSDSMRVELKPFGIHVAIVEPGIIQTEFDKVMAGPLKERSGKGAYSKIAETILSSSKKIYENKWTSSPPSVIAEEISKAVNSENPKTRYVAGKMAKPMMWIRKYLGDNIFDKLLLMQMKK